MPKLALWGHDCPETGTVLSIRGNCKLCGERPPWKHETDWPTVGPLLVAALEATTEAKKNCEFRVAQHGTCHGKPQHMCVPCQVRDALEKTRP